jgi:hypothetical protein
MPDDITTSPDSDSSGESAAPDDVSDRPAAADADGMLNVPAPPDSPDIPIPHPGGPTPAPEVPDLPEIPDLPDVPDAPTPPSSTAPAVDRATAEDKTPTRDSESTTDAGGGVAEPASSPGSMPTVSPTTPPVPIPTVTPRSTPAPMPRVHPTQPADHPAQAVAEPEPAAAPESASEESAAVPESASEESAAVPESASEESAAVAEPQESAAAEGPATPGGPQPPDRHGPRPRGGRPGAPGRPGGRPGGGRPSPVPAAAAHTAVHSAVVEPVVENVDPHQWGRIDENGVVFVQTAAGERAIGNWQAGDAEAGLAHFGRKFDDFNTEIALLEARLASGTGDPKATKAQAITLRDQVESLAAIGDLDNAAVRLEIVIGVADAAIAGASTARIAARAAAVKAKEDLCAEAEALAESTQWKSTGDRLKAIVEEWRTIRGVDRKTDDALWKRFAKARDTFTRRRGSHFAELDKQRGAAKEAKEELIKRAEALSDATEWGETAAKYRVLMDEWKATGRAPRDVEDALWARFRAAQEKFFSHRNQVFSERDAEFAANAAAKEKLLAEAEKIDPVAGLDQAKARLRSIHERWEAAGKVPRERIRELDSRLKVIEDRIKAAEDRHWRRTDPETEARVAQFRARVDTYRSQAEKARAAGDDRKAKEAEAQARQWEEWLRTAQSAVER